MIDRIHRRVQEWLAVERSFLFSVLVWGPGDPRWQEKRDRLSGLLKVDGFDAYTSELISAQTLAMQGDVSPRIPPSVEEIFHWQESDIVLALVFGLGPQTEVTEFSLFQEFRDKAVVFYPCEWHSIRNFRRTYWGSVLNLFPKIRAVTAEEDSNCDVVELCLEIARNERRHRLWKLRRVL
jgi:hypothetical protein